MENKTGNKIEKSLDGLCHNHLIYFKTQYKFGVAISVDSKNIVHLAYYDYDLQQTSN